MNMTSVRLAHASILLSTCNVSINLVNTKRKNFSNLDMQAATSSNSRLYLRSFLLVVSPIKMYTRKIRYTSNCMRKIVELPFLLSRSLFLAVALFYALSCICILEKTYLSSTRLLLLCIKIIIEYHNDVCVYIYI